MLDLHTLLVFSLACLALTVSPGPDMLLIAARSAAQGRMAGLMTYCGVSAGAFCHALALALGLSQLFLAVPYAYDVVRYIGVGYLLFLAWQAFAFKQGGMAQSPTPAIPLSMWVIFRQGLLTNLLNPKVAIFFLALFPQFVDPTQGAVGVQIILLAVILNVIGLGVNGVVILLAGTLAPGAGRFATWSRYLLGVVFAGLAAKLILDGPR